MSRSPSVVPSGAINRLVAHFDVYFRSSPETALRNIAKVDRLLAEIPIFSHDEFYLGRGDSCRGELDDPTVSNRHAKVHCLTFESDGGPPLPPLVYVTDMSSNGTYLTEDDEEEEQKLDRKSSPRLLFVNDVLRLGGNTFCILRFEAEATAAPRLTKVQEMESKLFEHEYEMYSQVVGVGGQGAVYIAANTTSRRQVACKVLSLGKISYDEPTTPSSHERDQSGASLNESTATSKKQRENDSHARAYREIQLLKDLNHPNIVNIEKIFWSNNNVYIFQELVTGGDLFSFIEFKKNNLHDVEAALILLQVLKGVEYLHNLNIVHRDLKPENILMTSFSADSRIMLADFGSSRQIPTTVMGCGNVTRMYSLVGTLEYTAPEMHKRNRAVLPDQGYSKAVDTWAIGVIASILISGQSIFIDIEDRTYHENPRESILGMASTCDMSVLDTRLSWQSAGKRAKDFVKQLLVLDESKRMTVQQALAHPWFTNRINADHFQKLYQRAISDWQPRPKYLRFIERLDDSNTRTLIRCISQDLNDSTASHHFHTSKVPEIEQLGNKTMASGESQSVCESVLPQILEEDEECQHPIDDSPNSTINQRARDLIAQDMEEMNMSLSMNELSLEFKPMDWDMDLNDAGDEGTDSVAPIYMPLPLNQLQRKRELSESNTEESESPDPIAVASTAHQEQQSKTPGAVRPRTAASNIPKLRKPTKPRIRPPPRAHVVTKLSDMYVGDGFDGVLPYLNPTPRRIVRGWKRLRLA